MRPTLLPALLLLLACSKSEELPTAPPIKERPDPTRVDAPDGLAPHAHMQLHMEALTKARDAVIRGKLDEAVGPLAWLDDHEPPKDKLPRGWQPYVVAMEGAAARGRHAESLREVAQAVADTAQQCGRCHSAMGASLSFGEVPLPEGSGAADHMQRHYWAMDRMWEGVVASDGDRWRSGAMVLLEDPLDELQAPEGRVVPGSLGVLSQRIHDLGEAGLGTVTGADQAVILGEALATCGGCHALAEAAAAAPD